MPFRSSGRGAYGPQGQRVIKGPLAPVWTTFSPPNITSAAAYSYQFVATDDSGDAPTYSLASGSVPTGLSLSSSGLLSGTATASGSYTFTVRATDVNGRFTDTSSITMSVSLAISYQFALAGGGGSYPNSNDFRAGHGGVGVFTMDSTPGKTFGYQIGGGASGTTGGAGGGGNSPGPGGAGGGGTWITFAGAGGQGDIVAAVGGGGGGVYYSDYAGNGGAMNGNGGTAVDPYGSPVGTGGTLSGPGGGYSSGSGRTGGYPCSWGGAGGGGYFGGGGGACDQQGQGGTPGGGGSGYLNIPSGFGTNVSVVYNQGGGATNGSITGTTDLGGSTYFGNANVGKSQNAGGLRVWKAGTLIFNQQSAGSGSFTLT